MLGIEKQFLLQAKKWTSGLENQYHTTEKGRFYRRQR